MRRFAGSASDDQKLFIMRRDLSGGINNRSYAGNIAENQVTLLYNADLSIPGQMKRRPGYTLLQSLASHPGVGLFGFEPRGGTNRLIEAHNDQYKWYAAAGSFGSIASLASISAGLDTNMIKCGELGDTPGDVVLISNGTDNVKRLEPTTPSFQDCGDTNNSPPKTKVLNYYRNRVWGLQSNKLFFSDALPVKNASRSGYATAFDRTTNYFNMPVGTEQAIVGLRNSGLLAFGSDKIYTVNPSAVPVATDFVDKVLDIGCVEGKTVCEVGDDVYFLAKDGVRGVMKSANDKSTGQTLPISYPLKTEVEALTWSSIDKACAVYFDNKYFISLPSSSTTNNQVWIYYPAGNAWMVVTGWNIARFAKMSVSNEERLYGISSTGAIVYRIWTGHSDNGTAITFQEEGRNEDLGQPLVKKQGGEVSVKARTSGDYNISVMISFDDNDYQTLGTLNILANEVNFATYSFPMVFQDAAVAQKKFHLSPYSPWYVCRVKLYHSAVSTSDIAILERSVISYPEGFIDEEVGQ